MEDPELLAADCVVICTCCPCLVLQLLLFLLIRLPCKLAKRSKKLVLRRLRARARRGRRRREVAATEMIVIREDPFDGFVQMGVADAVAGRGGRRVCAIAEAQRVLEQLYEEGELGFGGFWRRSEHGGGRGEPLGAGLPRHCRLVVRGGGGRDGGGPNDVHCVQVLYMYTVPRQQGSPLEERGSGGASQPLRVSSLSPVLSLIPGTTDGHDRR